MPQTAEYDASEMSVVRQYLNPQARKNALTLVLGFATIIAIGTILLRLPIAGTHRALTWSEAFFTATSATTVTGLVVVNTALDLSLFGQLVVLLLIQVGGIGFVTFSVLLFALIGRRLGIAERILLRQSLGVLQTVGIGQLTRVVVGAVLAIELVGALLLWLRWWPTLGPAEAAYMAMFHSVSAFCNAGFDLYAGTGSILFGYGRDPYTLTVMLLLILIGGLGILVITDLVTFPIDRRLMVYTKLTLLITGILTGAGLLFLMFDPVLDSPDVGITSFVERFWVALFSVVGQRTAGLTIIPIEDLTSASALTFIAAMFIGGAPASMAGGVTISTAAVLVVAVASTIRGSPQAVAFGRTMPLETISKAVAIMTVSTLLCFFVTLGLLIDGATDPFITTFEVVSAFSNTGYSMGATTELSFTGRILIAFTMFWGRLGPLTIMVLLAQRERPNQALYPSERIVMG